MERYDILILGGGAAGIAAAKGAYEAGCRSILLVDSGKNCGGVLLQCSHKGFGPGLSGPEFTAGLLKDFPKGVKLALKTEIIKISPDKWALLSGAEGEMAVGFKRLIMAAGCMERPIGALPVAGTRPRGVYTAGHMQALMNLHAHVPKGPVIIMGSGDMGLIMARQIAELGIEVCIVEIAESCGGTARNRSCLKMENIRLICGDTVSEIMGSPYIEAVRLRSGLLLPCSTLLTAVGLIPDRALVKGLEAEEWLSFCGNCSSIHTMVESVVNEGRQAGIAACKKIRGDL